MQSSHGHGPAEDRAAHPPLGCAVLLVGDHPISFGLIATESIVVMGFQEAQVVPARTRPLWHRVEFSSPSLSVSLECSPVMGTAQRRIGQRILILFGGHRSIIVDFRKFEREIRIVQCDDLAVRSVEDGEGFAPVSLPAEEPIAELVVDRAVAASPLIEPGGDTLLEFGRG